MLRLWQLRYIVVPTLIPQGKQEEVYMAYEESNVMATRHKKFGGISWHQHLLKYIETKWIQAHISAC